jgi:hypothetical protein
MMITDNELIEQLTAERDSLAAQVEQLNSHIIKMQEFCAQYITPRGGIGDAEFINKIIYFLDGPEQRLAQSSPAQCLAEIKAQQPQPDDWKKKIDKARDEAKAALDEWIDAEGE